MDTSSTRARMRVRRTVAVVQFVFSWWIVVPVSWIAFFNGLMSEGLGFVKTGLAATFLAVMVGLAVALIVQLVCLALLKVIGDGKESGFICPRCTSRRSNGSFCGNCGLRFPGERAAAPPRSGPAARAQLPGWAPGRTFSGRNG